MPIINVIFVFCVSVKVKLSVYCKVWTYRSIIVFVCILPEKAVSEMTYTVSGGTLNPTHSLTHFQNFFTGTLCSRVVQENKVWNKNQGTP